MNINDYIVLVYFILDFCVVQFIIVNVVMVFDWSFFFVYIIDYNVDDEDDIYYFFYYSIDIEGCFVELEKKEIGVI